jgi:thioesterase domain-containing protein/acyl carrier protein
VKDRFGDYGFVGLLIARETPAALEVDSFLLSCRVLGRGVEHRMLAFLGDLARQRGLPNVEAKLVRTPKNKPALDFLVAVGSAFMKPFPTGFQFSFPSGFASEVVFSLQTSEAPADTMAPVPAPSPFPNGLYHTGRIYCALAAQGMGRRNGHARPIWQRAPRKRGKAAPVPPKTRLQRELAEVWQELLKLERVGIRDNFFDLGGHSLLAVRLFAAIERLTGRKLPLITLFQAATIEEISRLLEQDNPNSLLVPIQTRGERPPLFLVHGAGGDVLWGYANLAASMPPNQPIYGIKSRGQLGLDEFSDITEMATAYVQEIRSFQPDGPYSLGGYCFGGNVAYEMARQLQSQGQQVDLVALLDAAPSNAGYERITWWQPSYSVRFVRNLAYWLSDFSALDARDRMEFFRRKSRALWRKLRRKTGFGGLENPTDLEDVIDPTQFPAHELKLWQAHLNALVAHQDKPFEGRVVLFRTRGQPLFCSLEEDFCWRRLAPGMEVVHIPGAHESIFMEPNVRALSAALAERLVRPGAGVGDHTPFPVAP